MNKQEKQELIEWISKFSVTTHTALGRIMSINTDVLVNKIQQIDEPKKVKVKQYVADWFEEHKDFLELSLGRITPDIRTKIVQGQALSEFEKWFNKTRNKPFETIIRMKDGYEVEEEPLFYIRLTIPSSSVVELYLGFNKDGIFDHSYGKPHVTWDWKCTFTEHEIKSIDERYWPFAMPVEKV
ncbi:DUF1642 domain-containing protein [Enterococcus xiangfangensis]|uniref:DUF1642 domain-containing protein n=1 Tax=Enterococcus xiangfangensis TaxID=1296537 RepID=UPI0010F4820E|nr:DUF1642 domain-containing protein [Enterococcus xiangfangensis]MBM7711468.1 hypothetical protein [Enterococcus xiangfangensis]